MDNVCVNEDKVITQNQTLADKELVFQVVREYWIQPMYIRRKYADNLAMLMRTHLESWKASSLTWVDKYMSLSDKLLKPYGYVEETDYISHGFSYPDTLAYKMETIPWSSWDNICRFKRLKYLDLHIPGTLTTFCHSCYPLLKNDTNISNICYHPGNPTIFDNENSESNESSENSESNESSENSDEED